MSTATAIPAPVAVYREEQLFAWWVYALMAGLVTLAGVFYANRPDAVPATPHPLSLILLGGLVLPGVFTVGVLRMTTEVTAGVEVWFGWIPTHHRTLDAGVIRRVEIVTYRPLRDFGGWGVRHGRDGELRLECSGKSRRRLYLADGSRLLIGSQTPEALAAAIERAMNPA